MDLNFPNLSLFNRFCAILTNINPILKDLIVIYEILTNYYPRYQDNTKIFNNFSFIPLSFLEIYAIFDDIFSIT
jgi:hypothetical protein